jgi:hypothetical protein
MADTAKASIYKGMRKKVINASDNSSVDLTTLSLWDKIFGKAKQRDKDLERIGYGKKNKD